MICSKTNLFCYDCRNREVLSWTGIDGNRTVGETIDLLYKPDLDNINVESLVNGTKAFIITKRMIWPYGICKVVEGNPNQIMYDFFGYNVVRILSKGRDF